jgi:hypothetical protein
MSTEHRIPHHGVIPSKGIFEPMNLDRRRELAKKFESFERKELLMCEKIRSYIADIGPISDADTLRLLYKQCVRRLVWSEKEFADKFQYEYFTQVFTQDTHIDSFPFEFNSTEYTFELWRCNTGQYEMRVEDSGVHALVEGISRNDAELSVGLPFEWGALE